MDSSTRLDYALFQLTPTRTRCDLVVFSGGVNEKLASGLLEPFISHLRCAKDQIPKGGYSITLRAPTADASWFTKGTFERFVRFISTPEVLERFVTIEREILQIESSVQSNELSNTTATGHEEEGNGTAVDGNAKKSIVPFKPKSESNCIDDATQEETSKLRLQRVLETRKAVLRKEQAMAYARAFVAGFEMDCIDDLISFSEAFGASRLREACINFKELCNKKRNDRLWMDELAAMEPCTQPDLPYLGTSGIILTSENNTPSQSIMQNFHNGNLSNGKLELNGSFDASVSDSTTSHASSDINQGQMPPTTEKAQVPMSWPNQLPHFMYNFQGPVMQQMPPYQGYPFPGMPVVPPYYQRNMQWPPNTPEDESGLRESDHPRNRKLSSGKKEKASKGKESETSEQDEHTEPGDFTSGSDLEEYSQHNGKHSSIEKPRKRKNGKKSSRMVVIRNINYITSKKNDGEKDGASDESSSAEDEFIDGDSLKQKVEDAVGSLEKHHKSTMRHSKKIGGKKNRTVINESNGAADLDLEDHSVTKISDRGKANENWNTFQNLLMRGDESDPNEAEKQCTLDVQDEYFTIKSSESGSPFSISQSVDLESEKRIKKRFIATDSFIVNKGDVDNEGRVGLENFERGQNTWPSLKKSDCTNEDLLFSRRMDETEINVRDTLSDCNTEVSVLKTQKGEDWFIINSQQEKSVGMDAINGNSILNGHRASTLEGDYFCTEKIRKDVLVDDSFMVQAQSVANDVTDSEWKTDISMVSDLNVAYQHESGSSDLSGDKLRVSGTCEPDDLCMVLERDSGVEQSGASWTPEIDYGIDISIKEADKTHSGIEAGGFVDDKKTANGKNGDPESKLSGKETRSKPLRGSLGKSKPEIISRNKKPSSVNRATVQKSKLEKEEENRKKMEELMILRQKRIAERSATSGFTSATSKRVPVESKTTVTSIKDDKQKSRSATQDINKLSSPKPGITRSTIDRLASGHIKDKGSSTPLSKSIQPMKTIPKVNGVVAKTLSPKTARDGNKKSDTNKLKPSDCRNDIVDGDLSFSASNQVNGVHSSLSDVKKNKDRIDDPEIKLQVEPNAPQGQPLDGKAGLDTSEDKKVLSSKIMKIEKEKVSDIYDKVGKNCGEVPIDREDLPLPVGNRSSQQSSLKMEDDNRRRSIASPVLHEEKNVNCSTQVNEFIAETIVDPLPSVPKEALNSTAANLEEAIGAKNVKFLVPAEVAEIEITSDPFESTPPPTNGLSPEPTHSRKKWTGNEDSPPATKGFRKLLLFGRKKPQLSA